MQRVKFTTSLDEELLLRVKKIAIDRRCDVADILEELLREYLEKAE